MKCPIYTHPKCLSHWRILTFWRADCRLALWWELSLHHHNKVTNHNKAAIFHFGVKFAKWDPPLPHTDTMISQQQLSLFSTGGSHWSSQLWCLADIIGFCNSVVWAYIVAKFPSLFVAGLIPAFLFWLHNPWLLLRNGCQLGDCLETCHRMSWVCH